MASQFNVDLPPRFEYSKLEAREKEEELEDYLDRFSIAIEENMKKAFIRTAEAVDSPTADNLSKIDVDGQIADSGVAYDNLVLKTGAQTIAGVKTFSSFPITPSSAPTTDYQVANKKYVNDNGAISQSSQVSISGSTASTNWADMTGATVTLTTTGGPVLIMFSIAGYNSSAGAYNYIILDIDSSGIAQTERRHYADSGAVNMYFSMTLQYLHTPSAASHTWKIQYKVNTGTFNTAYGYLTVIEYN